MKKKQQGTVAWSTSTVGDASRPRGTTDVRERVPRPERINGLVNLVLCKRGRQAAWLVFGWALGRRMCTSACAKYLIQCAKAEPQADGELCS